MEYKILVEVPTIMSVTASSESSAIDTAIKILVESRQLKPADPVKIQVITENA